MSAIVLSPPASLTVRPEGLLAGLRSRAPVFFDLGILMLALMPPTAFAMLADQRLIHGISVWDKPLKFQFALVVYLLTLAFFARFLPAGVQARRWYRVFIGAVGFAAIVEMVWLMGAATLGVPSHFNTSPVGMVIYPAMGAFAALITSATAVLAFHIARSPATGLAPALKEALVTGLALTLPLTLLTAGVLSSGTGHWVGGAADDSGGLSLLNWARDGGDLRVAHFFATHAMHVVPAFGLVSATLLGGGNRLPVRLFAAGYAGFVIFTLGQALAGRPFLPMLG